VRQAVLYSHQARFAHEGTSSHVGAVLGLIVLAGAFLAGGILNGERTASVDNRTASVDNRAAARDQPSRDFMFQVIGVRLPHPGDHL